MRAIEQSEEAADTSMGSARLQAISKAIYDCLVSGSGPCESVQGELVRANDRICSEHLRNGMGNYYFDDQSGKLGDNYYGQLEFLLDTLIENRNRALSDEDVAYFAEVRRLVEPDWARTCRLTELEGSEVDLSEAERHELEALLAAENQPAWEELYNRAQRCIVNWCLANPRLMDRQGKHVEERGIHDLTSLLRPLA